MVAFLVIAGLSSNNWCFYMKELQQAIAVGDWTKHTEMTGMTEQFYKFDKLKTKIQMQKQKLFYPVFIL